MHHVHRVARHLGQGQPTVHRLGFHHRRTGHGVSSRGQVPGRPLGPDALGDHVAVFAVAAHDAALTGHRLHHLQGLAVGDAQVVVGQVDFVGGDALGGHIGQLGPDAGVPVLDGHMEAVVTGGTSVGTSVPGLQGGGQGAAPLGLGKVQHAGGAARQSRSGAGHPVVRRLVGQALVHLKVGVGVDKAGEHQLARCLDDLAALRGQVGADGGDFVPVDPQVGGHGTLGQDEGAPTDEGGCTLRHNKTSVPPHGGVSLRFRDGYSAPQRRTAGRPCPASPPWAHRRP